MSLSDRSPIARDAFASLTEQHIPDNTVGEITPARLRVVFDALADSALWHDEFSTGPSGASAYEIAVTAGFVGDPAAWLASLVGPAGPVGPRGATGAKGATGPAGPAGADGRSIASVRAVAGPTIDLSLADDGTMLSVNSEEPTEVILPADAAVPMRIGALVYVRRSGAGDVRIAAGDGALLSMAAPYLPSVGFQHGVIAALKIAPNTWHVAGDVSIPENAIVGADAGASAGVMATTATVLTLDASHVATLVELSADEPATVVAPADDDIAVGSVIRVAQAGGGSISFIPGPGAALRHCETRAATTSGRNALVELHKTAPDAWRMTGDLALLKSFA